MLHEYPSDPSKRKRNRPDFHQLAMFLKVVDTRSFAATAREVGCSQPAISQAIARLEDICGGNLFERRRGAALALTPIGEAILPSARMLLHTVEEQMQRAVEAARGHVGIVTLGFHAGLAGGLLRTGVAHFRAKYPDVRVRMVEATPASLHRQLVEQSIDLVIAALTPDFAGDSCVRERLWEEPLCAALPANHPLAAKRDLDWYAIASIPFLVSAESAELAAVRRLAADRVGHPPKVEEYGVSRDALFEMVGMGAAISVVLGSPTVPYRGVAFRPIGDIGRIAIEAVWRAHDSNPLRHRLLHHIRQRHGTDEG